MKRALDAPAWAALDTSALTNGFDDYDIDSRTPNAIGILAEFQRRSEDAREKPGLCLSTVSYGSDPLAVADVFTPEQGPIRGSIVFVHGGYWKGKSRPNRAFLAPAWMDAGVQWVNLGYPVAPDMPMPEIARHIGGALRRIVDGESPFDMIQGPVVLTGNSAGAHLLANALAHDLPVMTRKKILGSLLLSGLYDLRPLLATPANEWMRLDDEQAFRLSPLCHSPPKVRAPIVVSVGSEEPDAFIAQSRAYAQSMLGYAAVHYHEAPGLNHMTMIGALDSPTSPLGRFMAEWLGVGR